MIATLTRKVTEDTTLFISLLSGLLAVSLVPLLLIIQFDLTEVLLYPLALVSILSSISIAYLVGAIIGERRNQNRVR